MATDNTKKRALIAAFPHTIPILTGFLFLGLAYGIYMNASGFSFVYPLITSLLVYGGGLEFVLVSMLLAPYNPIQAFTIALLIQARHIFYGIAMLDKFKGLGLKKFYMIFSLCDETFSIISSKAPPPGVDKGWFMFFIGLLNQIYWVVGATLGGLVGEYIAFDTTGIDFVMTAMFVVIFTENWLKEKNHTSSIIGIVVSLGCLLIFGPEFFMIPTMIGILLLLTILRKPFLGDVVVGDDTAATVTLDLDIHDEEDRYDH